ncbi:MAG: BolA family transcriptional regulator [Gammaproteobacteria bacterium]|nr:BolA family transcriptional regulator [Gammaproteobacteria bacterium]
MTPEKVKELIAKNFAGDEIEVSGDGSMFDARIVSQQFEGLSLVKKQQLVYKAVNDYITSGEIHALTMKTFTPAEWKTASKLQVS